MSLVGLWREAGVEARGGAAMKRAAAPRSCCSPPPPSRAASAVPRPRFVAGLEPRRHDLRRLRRLQRRRRLARATPAPRCAAPSPLVGDRHLRPRAGRPSPSSARPPAPAPGPTICAPTAAPYTCSWDTTGVADGLYDLRAIALDALGLLAAPARSTLAPRRQHRAGHRASAPRTPLTGTATRQRHRDRRRQRRDLRRLRGAPVLRRQLDRRSAPTAARPTPAPGTRRPSPTAPGTSAPPRPTAPATPSSSTTARPDRRQHRADRSPLDEPRQPARRHRHAGLDDRRRRRHRA